MWKNPSRHPSPKTPHCCRAYPGNTLKFLALVGSCPPTLQSSGPTRSPKVSLVVEPGSCLYQRSRQAAPRDRSQFHPVSFPRKLMNLLLPTLAEPQSFSLAEKLLFAALAAASAAVFWHRFHPILRKILTSRQDPGFHLSPLGKHSGSSSGRFWARPGSSVDAPFRVLRTHSFSGLFAPSPWLP